MKKFNVAIVLLMLSSSFAVSVAQQTEGQYLRKSVSSIRDILVKPNQIPRGTDIDEAFMSRMMRFYIEVPRFDYNNLPESVVSDFLVEVNRLDSLSTSAIGEVVFKTVAVKVREILTNPEIMEARVKGFKTEADLATFAATKAKELTLSESDLALLMNSAYFYLPYITRIKKSVDKESKMVTVSIKGGMIWYQIKETANGKVEVVEISNKSISESYGFSQIGESRYNRFVFGNQSFRTDAHNYALYDAVQTFAKNAGVLTKEINDFKLTSQLIEVSANSVGFNLGKKEGVHLDDGFYVKRASENSKGDVVYREVAYVRVTKTGDNKADPSALTKATKVIVGDSPQIGDVVFENPRIGIDIRVKGGSSSLSVPFSSIILEKPDLESALNSNYDGEFTTAYMLEFDLAYNISAITGTPQTYFDLSVSLGTALAPDYDYNEDYQPGLVAGYAGFTRKFGLRRLSLTLGFAAGVDMFSFSELGSSSSDSNSSDSEDSNDNLNYQFITGGVRGVAGLELLLTPNFSLFASAGYKYAFAAEDDPQLGGLAITAGFTYSLRQLPFNPFGFLDPLKTY